MFDLAAPLGLCVGVALWSPASAAPCGTLSAPTLCSLTTAAGVTVSATNFVFDAGPKIGNGTVYAAGDVTIDLVAIDPDTFKIEFSRNPSGPNPASSFFSNPGDGSSFVIDYLLTVSAAAGNSVDILDPMTVAIGPSSTVEGGFVQVQLLVPFGPLDCLARTTVSINNKVADCAVPGSVTTSVDATNRVFFGATTGNASFLSFFNQFNIAVAPSEVPNPASLLLVLTGLLGLRLTRRRR